MYQLVRRMIAITVAFVFFLPQSAVAAPVVIPDGTPVHVMMLQTLVSGETKENSLVHFTVTQDVVVEGRVAIARGARAIGRVTWSRERGILGKSGSLEFTLDSVIAVDKTRISLRPNSHGGKGAGHETGVIVGAVFLMVCMLFINGQDITVKEGTELTGYADGDFKVDAEAMDGAVEAAVPNAAFTIIDKSQTDTAVIGKIRNNGPDAACAEIVVIVEKDGKAVGVGKALTPAINAKEEKLFSVDIKGSTDGTLMVQANVKPTGVTLPAAALADVAILSKIITDKEVAGKIKNISDTTRDITVNATCAENGKVVGTGTVKVKGVAPGEEKDYIITVKGKTATDVTVTVESVPVKP